MQQEVHDPVLQIKHINEFCWCMLKLNALLAESINETTSRLTNYTKFLKEVKLEEGSNKYHEIELLHFDASSEKIKNANSEVLLRLTAKMCERLEDLKAHPVFNSIAILDCSCWPRDELNLSVYEGNRCVIQAFLSPVVQQWL